MATKNIPRKLDLELVRSRIRGLMRSQGTNAKAVSKKARLGDTAVSDLLNEKNTNPSLEHLRAIAVLGLNSTVGFLTGEHDSETGAPTRSIEAIPIAGIAEAGAFRQMEEFGPEREQELPHVNAPRSKAYPRARHFALEIRGDSMNAAKPTPLLEGMLALCVDIIDAEIMVETGRIYAVRQTLDGGQTYECTIKRAHVFRGRIELRPESTNKNHKTIIVPRGQDEFDGKKIEAFGLVYGTFSSMEG